MTVLVDHQLVRRPHAQGCSRCGQPRAARIVLRAQPIHSRSRPLAASAGGFCEACALDVFIALEDELERQLASAPPRALDPDREDEHG
jgi:hypothetical protein